ncbi:MAG: hypothetical protein ACRDTR_22025, partial [Rubrobacter sp.]
LFAALGRFREAEGKHVTYLPGNHDAEGWWNPRIQETLRERGLVDEFAYHYLATMEVGGRRRMIYCEHGNQLDPANTVEDYQDPLDTPLGHHVVTDFTRRIAPYGEVSPGLDVSEIKMVYPLVAIPGWVASRYFYDLAGKVFSYLVLPLLVVYLAYHAAAYFLAGGAPGGTVRGARELLLLHEFFIGVIVFVLVMLVIFGLFFLVIRHTLRGVLAATETGEKRSQVKVHYSPAEVSQREIESIVRGDGRAPMDPSLDPTAVDVFVSGHTHLPSLTEIERPDGSRVVVANSGCWLRQLQPVSPRFKGPPVYVSKFVLTHVRVYAQDGSLRVELWEQPKPARQSLTRLERLVSWRKRQPQPPPHAKPRVRSSFSLYGG